MVSSASYDLKSGQFYKRFLTINTYLYIYTKPYHIEFSYHSQIYVFLVGKRIEQSSKVLVST